VLSILPDSTLVLPLWNSMLDALIHLVSNAVGCITSKEEPRQFVEGQLG
jgi:hypothetical protein